MIHNPAEGAKLLKYPRGHIYQLFGENVELYRAAIGTEGHNGIDIAMEEGTPILATAGEVCETKTDPGGYGRHIRIITDKDENGKFYELTYGHLRDVGVSVGTRVSDGQSIGTMGNTGFVISGNTPYWGNAPAGRGVHLHFGARECSETNTGWMTQYSTGRIVYIKNYQNGFKGSVDPLPLLPPAIPAFSHQFLVDLVYGDQSGEVRALQQALKIDGEFPQSVPETGFYGYITLRAVKDFQRKYGIISWGTPGTTGYGRVGLKTRTKLNELFV